MSDWYEAKIKDFADVKGGKRLPKGKQLVKEPNNHPYIRIRNLGKAKYLQLTSEYEYVDDETQQSISRYIVNKGDILISVVGTIGLIGIVGATLDGANQTENCDKIINIAGVMPEYLYYYLKSNFGQEEIRKGTVGAVQPKLPLKNVQDISVFYPSMEEQEKIVAILSAIDEKIETNEAVNNNLEQQAQAVYYKMFSEVNTVPVELSSIIDVRDGTHDSPKAQATGYYLITSKHLLPFGVDKASANHISKADFDKINERSLVETQDILMSMIGTIGLISYIPYETVDFAIKNVALFKTSHTPELAYYFLCYLKSEKTLQHIGKCLAGSTQKYISLGELRKMPIYSPTTNEIREFNCLVKPMFEKIVSRTYENALLAEMRDSLLPKLMSGELDVSKIDI